MHMSSLCFLMPGKHFRHTLLVILRRPKSPIFLYHFHFIRFFTTLLSLMQLLWIHIMLHAMTCSHQCYKERNLGINFTVSLFFLQQCIILRFNTVSIMLIFLDQICAFLIFKLFSTCFSHSFIYHFFTSYFYLHGSTVYIELYYYGKFIVLIR